MLIYEIRWSWKRCFFHAFHPKECSYGKRKSEEISPINEEFCVFEYTGIYTSFNSSWGPYFFRVTALRHLPLLFLFPLRNPLLVIQPTTTPNLPSVSLSLSTFLTASHSLSLTHTHMHTHTHTHTQCLSLCSLYLSQSLWGLLLLNLPLIHNHKAVKASTSLTDLIATPNWERFLIIVETEWNTSWNATRKYGFNLARKLASRME